MHNHGLLENYHQDNSISQMGFYVHGSSSSSPPPAPNWTFGYLQSLTTTITDHISTETFSSSPSPPKHIDISTSSHLQDFDGPSVQPRSSSSWQKGGNNHVGVGAMKMKKVKLRKKVREPRFCFKTLSNVDVLDDGYKWRKYGQKVVKNTQHPRSYYRCTQDNCRVKKRVERLAEDPRMVITTYEGRHVHSPLLDLENSEASTQLNNFFW
ncbi:hypothetical protein GIB67_042350 [Kingdonia uniflora]|uniref:WRKY domain-containing protein n=1 Tax=Kingdonia uniflora TaxID=39325 RepID=A0A7J7LZL1_9MAGN|nr:hypothetical protein GIB67_020466 [Kingdonia uniflora]KAF6147968.1 hypothetical protein GIB67_042350 [Kingdonia uniflora]